MDALDYRRPLPRPLQRSAIGQSVSYCRLLASSSFLALAESVEGQPRGPVSTQGPALMCYC